MVQQDIKNFFFGKIIFLAKAYKKFYGHEPVDHMVEEELRTVKEHKKFLKKEYEEEYGNHIARELLEE